MKKKRKKRKNHFLNIMLTFGGVFTGVMILGILAFLLLWKIGDERADGNSLDKPAEAEPQSNIPQQDGGNYEDYYGDMEDFFNQFFGRGYAA